MDDKLALADINLDVIKDSLSQITSHHKEVGKIETPKGLIKKKAGFDYVELSYMKKFLGTLVLGAALLINGPVTAETAHWHPESGRRHRTPPGHGSDPWPETVTPVAPDGPRSGGGLRR